MLPYFPTLSITYEHLSHICKIKQFITRKKVCSEFGFSNKDYYQIGEILILIFSFWSEKWLILNQQLSTRS